MKLLGFSFCVFGCLCMGVRAARSKSNRIRALRELCIALELMSGELSLRATSVPKLCSILRDQTEGSAQKLFCQLSVRLSDLGEEQFSALWKACVQSACSQLGSREREALKELGPVLGQYDLDMQELAIERCRTRLQQEQELAEQAYPSEQRLLLGIGVSAGLLLGVLLL